MKSTFAGLFFILLSPALTAESFFDQFIDPEDGMLDASQFLLDYEYGVLPVPFIITEPAIGNGGGLAGVFFHDPDPAWEGKSLDEKGRQNPVSITALATGGTDNGSVFVGGAHEGHYKKDSIRYDVLIGAADVNLDFYGSGDNYDDLGKNEFSAEALFISQQLAFRLGNSDWFLGGEFDYNDSTIKFDDRSQNPQLETLSVDSADVSLGAVLIYDSLSNPFTPGSGIESTTTYQRHDESFGGDYDYDEFSSKNQVYFTLVENWTAGVRLDGSFVDGDAPFWSLPYIELRGIPALRYQGEDVITSEFQANWTFHPRWTVLGFIGAGRATNNGFSDAKTQEAGGFGFRYMALRRLGLNMGLDFAKGPEDEVVYFNFGTSFD